MTRTVQSSGERNRWGRWILPVLLAAGAVAWLAASGGNQWWSQALRSELMIWLGVALAGLLLALQAVLGAMARLGRRRRGLTILKDQRGLAVLEFALLFPIAMAIVLLMIQTALLMAGNLLVHYSAYCAARSAIVWIPADVPTSEHDCWVYDAGLSGSRRQNSACERNRLNETKLLRIQHAAALALMPVAGAPPGGGGSGAMANSQVIRTGLARFHAGYGTALPGWAGSLLARKYEYAREHTEVTVDPPGSTGGGVSVGPAAVGAMTYNEREDIRVTVRHEFYLSVPYANRAFGRQVAPGRVTTEITASYVLTNQGRYDQVYVEINPDTLGPLLPR